jgi:hypothetical protein
MVDEGGYHRGAEWDGVSKKVTIISYRGAKNLQLIGADQRP